ncbi:MAG: hypothetical protein Q9196_006146 [Gyalolechia fulgens]
MPEPVRNTIERLDRPSAYYLGRNKKRKFNRDHVGREDRERTPEDTEDPLKDATTLYVGNLYAEGCIYVRFGSRSKLTRCRSFYTTEEQIHELFAK